MVRLEGCQGRSATREQLARAARLRPLLTYAIPLFAVQTLVELTRAYLALDDAAAGARTVLRQARDVLRRRPDLGILPNQADQRRATLDTIRGGIVGASSLTKAELRLLRLLSTHLTFREMGERLYVSQHTVKTQAISIYRKLGVSKRGHAVQRDDPAGRRGCQGRGRDSDLIADRIAPARSARSPRCPRRRRGRGDRRRRRRSRPAGTRSPASAGRAATSWSVSPSPWA